MYHQSKIRSTRQLALMLVLLATMLRGASRLSGTTTDLQGKPVAGANLKLSDAGSQKWKVASDQDGRFEFVGVADGVYTVTAAAPGFVEISRRITIPGNERLQLRFEQLAAHSDTVTVTADVNSVDIQSPDPAQRVLVREEILDANPGRPGAPVSIPGLPIETASSGIKAPQYFAPGVAGDHGEPIAAFIQVGMYLLPNNLSANAHGNGYSDPNIMVPAIIESVQIDGGAFNVREGNHSVDLAAT
jgi:hypothetical protein